MHKYLTEFIGTFFLVLSIGLASANAGPFAPLAIGATLMVMVFMGGHISGAHYNPAVSLAVLLRGAMGPVDFVIYVVVQLIGAVLAAVAVFYIIGSTFAPAPNLNSYSLLGVLLVEFLYTFALCLVVLNVATAKKAANNSYFGLAIGFTVTAAAFSAGGISGGAFNPAVGVGPTIVHANMGTGTYEHVWIYLAAPFAGGALAAIVFRFQEAGANAGS